MRIYGRGERVLGGEGNLYIEIAWRHVTRKAATGIRRVPFTAAVLSTASSRSTCCGNGLFEEGGH